MFQLAKQLWPINRSLTGRGIISSLKILKNINNKLKIKFFLSGKRVYDWKIPNEWIVNSATLKLNKKTIIDFKKNNLHLVGYSYPKFGKIKYLDLKKNLYFLKKQPNAIPYVTSYYHKNWGFCLSYNQFKKLKKATYQVNIDTKFKKGKMNYGEIFIKGRSKKEIFFSTYVCHPSMANNEISGPVVNIFLSRFINNLKNKNFSYRFVFLPETIGSIAYINKNLPKMKKNIIAGYNITCVGDERAFSYLPSRNENSLSDKILKYLLYWTDKKYKKYSWLERGSDERQYCSPGIDLPIASFMRSKYGEYPEYHTSLDKLNKVVTTKGLNTSLKFLQKVVYLHEIFFYPVAKYKCEPFLSKRNLYEKIGIKKKVFENSDILNFLSYSDGKNSVVDILEKCKISPEKIIDLIQVLKKNNLIKINKKQVLY